MASGRSTSLIGDTRVIISSVFVAAVAIAVLFFVLSEPSPGEVKIGVITPLTGPAASYGADILSGAMIAQKVINEEGGIGGAKIELVVEDGQCDSDVSVSKATKLVKTDRVIGIVGVVCSSTALAVGELAQSEDFILIASAASHPKVTEGSNVFRVNPNDLSQAYGMATHARYNLGYDKISILAVDNEYGRGLVEEFSDTYRRAGGSIEHTEWFGSDDTDFSGQIGNLGGSGLLLIVAHPSQHPQIAEQLVEAGKSQKRMADFNFGLVSGDLLSGATKGTVYPVVTFDKDLTANAGVLSREMVSNYSREPSIVASWGFDSLYALAKAAQGCSRISTECLRNNLNSLDVQGASGRIKFLGNGDIESVIFQFVESE